MAKDYTEELPYEVREKMSRNLVYVGIFSIIMVFAGLTSAYIVSMGGSFWIKFPFPTAFYFSTVAILLSSLTYHFTVKAAKNKDKKKAQLFILSTLFLGILFCTFQFKGYKQLVAQGAYIVSPITVTDGRYGDYFEVKQNGNFVEVDGNNFLLKGKLMTSAEMKSLQAFFKPFEAVKTMDNPTFSAPNSAFVLYYKNEPLQFVNGRYIKSDGKELQPTELHRLQQLSWNIRDGRGDFFHKGKLGKDFRIFFKGKELQYKDRTLYYQGKKLSVPLQNKMNSSRDTATAYLYVITIVHLLHILVTLIYLIRLTFVTFSGEITDGKVIKLSSGSIFWHFLDILWIYLLLFLIFIH